jgi:hypothetical protein
MQGVKEVILMTAAVFLHAPSPNHVKYAEKGQPSSLRSLWPTQRDTPNQRESMAEQMVLVVEGVDRL